MGFGNRAMLDTKKLSQLGTSYEINNESIGNTSEI